MRLESLSETAIVGSGEYGTVFAAPNRRVVKLFRAEGPESWQDGLARLHSEELRAYTLVSADAHLRRHAPMSDGQVSVARVTAADGADVSGHYLLDLGIMLEHLPGEATKLNDLPSLPAHIWRLIEQFAAAGVHANDASVFDIADLQSCKFIDVTTHVGNRLAADLIAKNAAPREELERFWQRE